MASTWRSYFNTYLDSRWLKHSSALTDKKPFPVIPFVFRIKSGLGDSHTYHWRKREGQYRPISKPIDCGLDLEEEVYRREVQGLINSLISFPL